MVNSSPHDSARRTIEAVLTQIDEAIERLDLRAATSTLHEFVAATNTQVSTIRPWKLLDDPEHEEDLAAILGELLATCQLLGQYLEPFLPQAAHRIQDACTPETISVGTKPAAIFPRLAGQ